MFSRSVPFTTMPDFAKQLSAVASVVRMHAIALLLLVIAIHAGAQDPRIGTWMLVSAQSSLEPANKLSITSVHDGVHVVMSGETHVDFVVKKDGHDTDVPGNPGFNQVELRRIDKHQSEVMEKKNGDVIATLRVKISADGKELTVTTVQKGHPDSITVWTRKGGARVAGDPMAGEWSEDLGKTRMRQGLQLKIEAAGNDGVRFNGDYSYTAHFDGKQYDVKNSRNDTVSLQLVDAHTVEAIYRRDEQESQKDRWVLSADRKQLTLTTSGSYESGQRVSEKLVFNRQ